MSLLSRHIVGACVFVERIYLETPIELISLHRYALRRGPEDHPVTCILELTAHLEVVGP